MVIFDHLSQTTDSFAALAESVQDLAKENARLKAELAALEPAMEKLAQDKASAAAEADYWRTRYSCRKADETARPYNVAAKRRKSA